jgi:hypothetical protein
LRLAPLDRKRSQLTRTVLCVVFALVGATLVQAAPFTEDAVKAAYLFRFAQYVEWPEKTDDQPFVIAVSGAEDVAVHLDRLLHGMTIDGRRAMVRRVTGVRDLDGVHILYISARSFARTRTLRTYAIQRPILIVTEDRNGLDGGGVINFIEVNRNLRFEISLNAADRSGLKINSALLSVAARVERRPQGSLKCIDGYPHRQRPSGCRIRMASAN